MRSRAALVIVAAWLQVGCYNYLPLGRSHLEPSSHLALTLTETGSEELARYLGPEALVLRGRYLGATEQGLSVSVESVESRRGAIARWAGETVVVPGDFVRAVDQRQVSRSKTFLLAGATLAGVVVAFEAFKRGASAPPSAGAGSGATAQ